jgi:hypothetical protein
MTSDERWRAVTWVEAPLFQFRSGALALDHSISEGKCIHRHLFVAYHSLPCLFPDRSQVEELPWLDSAPTDEQLAHPALCDAREAEADEDGGACDCICTEDGITGRRFKCANCANFDFCERCFERWTGVGREAGGAGAPTLTQAMKRLARAAGHTEAHGTQRVRKEQRRMRWTKEIWLPGNEMGVPLCVWICVLVLCTLWFAGVFSRRHVIQYGILTDCCLPFYTLIVSSAGSRLPSVSPRSVCVHSVPRRDAGR